MPKTASSRTMTISQRPSQPAARGGVNATRTARIREPPTDGSQQAGRFQRRPSTLRQAEPYPEPKATETAGLSSENHEHCLNTVAELERENGEMSKRVEQLEKDRRQLLSKQEQLHRELLEAQDSQTPVQTQDDLQRLMQEMLGTVNNWHQQVWGYMDASNNVAMSSILPDPGQQLWTNQDGELGNLGNNAVGTQELIGMDSF